MIKSALEYLLSLKRPETVEVDGRPYSTGTLARVNDVFVKVLPVHNLTALKDYLLANPDHLKLEDVVLHVESPSRVEVYSILCGKFNQRENFLYAEALLPNITFGNFVPLETFNILLQSLFVDTLSRADVLRVVGNISGEQVSTFQDDGVTQKVSARTGIAKVSDIPVPNPVILAPFRTFQEITQPESAFILRLRQQEGASPVAALFEADGGAWRNEAILAVRDWLTVNIPAGVTILA